MPQLPDVIRYTVL